MDILKVKLEGHKAKVLTDAGLFSISDLRVVRGPNIVKQVRQQPGPLLYRLHPKDGWQYSPDNFCGRYVFSQVPEGEWHANLTAILAAADAAGFGDW